MKARRGINPIWTAKHRTMILPGLAEHLLGFVSAKRLGIVVDMACGGGTCALRFAPRAMKVCALDVSEQQVQACRDAAKDSGIANIMATQQDVQRAWPMGKTSVDIVTGVGALSNLDEPAKALREAARVLKRDGQLLVGDFCIPSAAHEVWGVLSSLRYGTRRPYLDYHQYMDLLLGAGFEVVEYRAIRWRYCLNATLATLPPELANASLKAVQDMNGETKKLLRMQVRGKRVILEHDCFALRAKRIGALPSFRIDDVGKI
jgi:SAM-dependent methyltransferase